MANQLHLDIVTPERKLLSEAVDTVQVPGANGELGILPGHTPLISLLKTGVLSYTRGAGVEQLMVSGGFVEVSDDTVSVLAEIAERPEEVNADKARSDRELAEAEVAKLLTTGTEEEMAAANMRLDRAQTRLQLASGK